MQKIRYLLSNINLINILLAGILIAFAYFTFFPGSSVRVKYKKPVVAKKTAEKKPAEVKKGAQDEKNPFPTDYVVIAEQNVFHPDRKIPEQKDDQKEAAALPKPEFVLDGTLITDDLKMAFMEDKKAPVNTPGRPNRQTALKVGDSFSGFTLMEIDKDKVVMRRGEEKVVVALEDKEKSKTRHYSQPATTAVQPGSQPLPPQSTPAEAVRQRAATPRSATPGQQQNARQRFLNIFKSRNR